MAVKLIRAAEVKAGLRRMNVFESWASRWAWLEMAGAAYIILYDMLDTRPHLQLFVLFHLRVCLTSSDQFTSVQNY